PRLLLPVQIVVRRIFLSQAPERAARDRWHLFRLPRQWRLGTGFCLSLLGRRGVPHNFSDDRPPADEASLDPRAAATSANPPRPLCEINPALRPRNGFRTKARR